jgi:hypothetical protein
MAYQVIYYKTDAPTPGNENNDNDNDNEQSDKNGHNENNNVKSEAAANAKGIITRTGGIIGITIGSILLVLLIGLLIWKRSLVVAWFNKRNKNKRNIEFNDENNVTSRPTSFISTISRPNSVHISRSNSVVVPISSRPNSVISGNPNSGVGADNYLSIFTTL